jgi:hypothetical protein
VAPAPLLPPNAAGAERAQAVRAAFGVSTAQAENNIRTQDQATRVNIVGQVKAELGSAFAGVWFDNHTGQFVVPIATSLASSPIVAQPRRAAVGREFAAAALADDYRIEPVEFSRSELASAQVTLNEELAGFFADGGVRTGIDPTRNAITVMVADSADSTTLASIQHLVDRVGVSVNIEQRPDEAFNLQPTACTLRNNQCDRPFRGGQQIWSTDTPDPNSGIRNTCTAAFRANGWEGRKFILTAGHCVKNVGTGAVNWHWMASHIPSGRQSIGTTSQWHWPGKDWAKIDATGTFWDVAPWPTILGLPDWGVHDYPIVGEAKPYVGQTLCHTGAGSDTTCGIVTEENVTEEYDANGEKLHGMFEVYGNNLCSIGGDSGGPFFANNIALGILSGGGDGCGTWIVFSDIMEATAELSVNIAGAGAPEAITGAPSESPLPPNNERTVSGQVNPRGLPTTYQIEYGINGFQHDTAPVSAGSGQGFVSVWQTLYGLIPGTTYQYRIKAMNSLNTAYGSVGTFKTGTMPTINGNLPPQEVLTKQATIRASINPNNAPTTWWFEWGPTEAMGKETPLGTATGLGGVEVKHMLTGLTSNTKYWYRVIVNNSGGLRTGPTGTFTTAAPGWLSRFGGTGTEPGFFKNAIALTVDPAGNAYVADRNNHRIQKFDPDGNFLFQFGVKGTAPGQLSQPRAVAIDQQGDIWVHDEGRLQEFTASGAFIREIGAAEGVNRPSGVNTHIAIGANGDVYLASEYPGAIYHYSPTPNAEGKYFLGKATGAWSPEGIVRHPTNGSIYLLSEELPRAIFRLGTGAVPTPTKVCDIPWTTTPEIQKPEGFIIDSDGNGLITSSGTNQVVKIRLTPPCTALSGFGTKGVGPGQMMVPTSLALAPSGLLFVGDGQHTTAPGPGITRWTS